MNDSARPMSRVDTAWLRMDTEVNLMMIVGVWLLKPAVRCAEASSTLNWITWSFAASRHSSFFTVLHSLHGALVHTAGGDGRQPAAIESPPLGELDRVRDVGSRRGGLLQPSG
jgi:hypothetical protein